MSSRSWVEFQAKKGVAPIIACWRAYGSWLMGSVTVSSCQRRCNGIVKYCPVLSVKGNELGWPRRGRTQ